MLAQRPIIFTNFTSSTKTAIKDHPFLPRIKNRKPSSFREFRSSNRKPSSFREFRSDTSRRGSIRSSAFWGNGEDEGFGILGNEEEDEDKEEEGSPGFCPKSSTLARVDYILNRLSKWLVVTLFWIVIFWKPEARSLWAIVGNFTNLRISTMLKHVLNQERPVPGLRMDPGMPSTHAQSFFFTIPFAVMSLVEHIGVNALSLTVGGLAMAVAWYLSWLRVSHGLHTVSQVVVGAVLGLSFCIFWFWWWDAMVQELFFAHLWVRVLVALGVTIMCSTFVVFLIQTVLRVIRKLGESDNKNS